MVVAVGSWTSEHAADVHLGDTVVEVNGTAVVGYNHACACCASLLMPLTKLSEPLSLALLRPSGDDAAVISWREQVLGG